MKRWLDKTHVGDCRDLLQRMRSDGVQVQTCVTSPPYYGLRDYGTAHWRGGRKQCDHREVRGGANVASKAQTTNRGTQRYQYIGTCRKCGARRFDRQIGVEPTPADYVAQLVGVFRLIRDLLAPDGTAWLNLGDSYASGGRGVRDPGRSRLHPSYKQSPCLRSADPVGVKPKDLLGIPWRVALALHEDGWYLRSDIIEEVELYCPCGCGYVLDERYWRWSQDRELIWRKPNPMVTSVRDRPTRCHEYLFLLTKSARYYYDAAAVAEPALSRPSARASWRWDGQAPTRNRRSVWTITTKPFKGGHYATYPPELVEPCVLAGSRVGDTVLDPFMGSGTTALVAKRLGRHYIGCELNRAYVGLRQRNTAGRQRV